MPIPTGVGKWVISGTLPGGEVWQTAYYDFGRTIADFSDSNVVSVAATANFTNLHQAAKVLMSTSSLITALDGYFYNGGTSAAAHGHAPLLVTGTGASPHPAQISLVTTLRSANTTRRGRGRMYWPANGAAFTVATDLFVSTAVDALVDALGIWFQTLAAGGVHAGVVSQTAGTFAQLTSVDADYVPDTQRRRANKLHSTRHSHAAV